MTQAVRWAAVLGLLAIAVPALGQGVTIPAPPNVPRGLVIEIPPGPLVTATQRPIPPLSPAQAARLQRAQALRSSGAFDRARDTLLLVQRELPHHAEVVAELGRLAVARQDDAGLERLARAERAAARDSVLLGHELALALERLRRPREAADVALEVWAAAPDEAEWALETIVRLAPADSRAIRERMRRTSDRLPSRLDLVRGRAVLEWRAGDETAAIKTLASIDSSARARPPLRLAFAEGLLGSGNKKDSTMAANVILDLAADPRFPNADRTSAARRAWELFEARQAGKEGAPRVLQALKGIPAEAWPGDLVVAVARGLRQAGQTAGARALLDAPPASAVPQAEVRLERALSDLRDGPPERAIPALEAAAPASPEAAFRLAEAYFFAGRTDSALSAYQRAAANPRSPFAGAALERIYLLEDSSSPAALAVFGHVAYAEWRGDPKIAETLAESLYVVLGRGPLWAQSAILLSRYREADGDARGALEPALALADSLPQDRLAPFARQRAGDLYLLRLKDDAKALAQYEECLARYPRAWNAPEVRRKVEVLRRERRF